MHIGWEGPFKAGFHQRRSWGRSRSRSRRNASDQVKIENRSHIKFDGIGSRRNQNGPIFLRFRLWLRRLWSSEN